MRSKGVGLKAPLLGRDLKGEKTGVIVVDVQGDFTQWRGGSLAVPESGAHFIKQVGEATASLQSSGLPIFGFQDWHP